MFCFGIMSSDILIYYGINNFTMHIDLKTFAFFIRK